MCFLSQEESGYTCTPVPDSYPGPFLHLQVELKQLEEEIGSLLEKEEETMHELLQQMTAGSNSSNHERGNSLSSGGTDDSSSIGQFCCVGVTHTKIVRLL